MEKLSYRKRFSSDAKLIIALLRKQPQNRDELCKSAGIDLSTFYRSLPILKVRGIIKETKGGFALWTYVELNEDVDNALDKLEETVHVITLNRIASEIGRPLSEIEPIIYRIAKKRGMVVCQQEGEKVVKRKRKGILLV